MNSRGNGTSPSTIGYSDTSTLNPSTLTNSPRRTLLLSPSSSHPAYMNWSWLSVQGKSVCIYSSSRCSNSLWSFSAENLLYVNGIGWAIPCTGFPWCSVLPCLVSCTVAKSFGASGSPTPCHIHLTLSYHNKVYPCIYLCSMKLSNGFTWREEDTCGPIRERVAMLYYQVRTTRALRMDWGCQTKRGDGVSAVVSKYRHIWSVGSCKGPHVLYHEL